MPWKFEATGLDTLTKRNAWALQIEITVQPLANWNASTAQKLPSPDFTTSAVAVSDFPFGYETIKRVGMAEPGCAGNTSMSFECDNIFCGTTGNTILSGGLIVGLWYKVFTDTVTYNSVVYPVGARFQCVTGVLVYTGSGTVQQDYTILDILRVDYGAYDIHIKASEKDTGGSYVVKFWGIVDPTSIEYEMFDKSKPETWMVSFAADDCVQQLKRITSARWMAAGDGLTAPTAQYGGLLHADFDYDSTSHFLTFVGNLVFGGQTYYAGRYLLNRIFRKGYQTDDGVWYNPWEARHIKIVDILSQINIFLGCEAAINNGGNWSDFHSWRFYYNTHDSTGTGGETLSYVGIDELYVWACFNDTVQFIESYGFFDPNIEPSAPHSWKISGSPLEVLDRICSSFGMTYRIRVNSSGQRYLECIEYTKAQTTKTIEATEWNNVTKYATKTNTFACSGVEIVSTGSALGASEVASNAIRGDGSGSGSLKYDTFFLSANNHRALDSFRKKANEGFTSSGARLVDIRPMDTGYTCALFTLQGITGTTATASYSICMIMPRDNDTAAGSNPGNVMPWAEYDGTLGGVVVPSRTDDFHSFIEVPGMALALYLWNDVDKATDPVGFTRPRGDEIEIEVVGVDHTAAVYPPMELIVNEPFQSKTYVVTEIEENSVDDVTVYRGHTRDI